MTGLCAISTGPFKSALTECIPPRWWPSSGNTSEARFYWTMRVTPYRVCSKSNANTEPGSRSVRNLGGSGRWVFHLDFLLAPTMRGLQ
jgi:hypothetical protein